MKLSQIILTLFALLPLQAQSPLSPEILEAIAAVQAQYSKQEFMVPMRDGARLHTTVYSPNDLGSDYPFLITRTPYGSKPYGAASYKEELAPYPALSEEGFIFVFQDVRGRYRSEGSFVNMRPHNPNKKVGEVDENSDTFDTIEWLLANIPHNNGKVGIRGSSYPGFYTSCAIIDSHPAIKAASPQAPIADWFWDDMHHHGAFSLELAYSFFARFGRPRPEPTSNDRFDFNPASQDRYRYFLELGSLANVENNHFKGDVPFWTDMANHPNYDAFWQARNILPHLKNVNCAVLVVGGLFDAEDLYGPWHTYGAIESQNPRIQNTIVMGPWRHGGWLRHDGTFLADTWFGTNTSAWYQKNVDLPFFTHYLKGGPKPDLPEALVFETGANRWRSFDSWPPPDRKIKKLFLASGNQLSWEKPGGNDTSFDQYSSDPGKPVPYTRHHGLGWEARYMAEDQRFAATRPDVLVYESVALTEDLTFSGPLKIDLWVSTTGSDADWIVKLIDLQPSDLEPMVFDGESHPLAGAQLMVRSEIFRGRFRESYEVPKPFVPGQVTRVSFPCRMCSIPLSGGIES